MHLPKTAGSSFRHSLEECYGKKIMLDYADLPINTPPLQRNRNVLVSGLANEQRDFGEAECIHGHFMPAKYLLLHTARPLTFITWMRNPVERVISHYYFWQRRYWEDAPPLHKRVIEEKWSLEKFCLSDEMKDLYTQFLWGFPLENFDFIGITEHYMEDFSYFSKTFLPVQVKMFTENLNQGNTGKYPISKSLKKQVETFHESDMELYARALKFRSDRNGWLWARSSNLLRK